MSSSGPLLETLATPIVYGPSNKSTQTSLRTYSIPINKFLASNSLFSSVTTTNSMIYITNSSVINLVSVSSSNLSAFEVNGSGLTTEIQSATNSTGVTEGTEAMSQSISSESAITLFANATLPLSTSSATMAESNVGSPLLNLSEHSLQNQTSLMSATSVFSVVSASSNLSTTLNITNQPIFSAALTFAELWTSKLFGDASIAVSTSNATGATASTEIVEPQTSPTENMHMTTYVQPNLKGATQVSASVSVPALVYSSPMSFLTSLSGRPMSSSEPATKTPYENTTATPVVILSSWESAAMIGTESMQSTTVATSTTTSTQIKIQGISGTTSPEASLTETVTLPRNLTESSSNPATAYFATESPSSSFAVSTPFPDTTSGLIMVEGTTVATMMESHTNGGFTQSSSRTAAEWVSETSNEGTTIATMTESTPHMTSPEASLTEAVNMPLNPTAVSSNPAATYSATQNPSFPAAVSTAFPRTTGGLTLSSSGTTAAWVSETSMEGTTVATSTDSDTIGGLTGSSSWTAAEWVSETLIEDTTKEAARTEMSWRGPTNASLPLAPNRSTFDGVTQFYKAGSSTTSVSIDRTSIPVDTRERNSETDTDLRSTELYEDMAYTTIMTSTQFGDKVYSAPQVSWTEKINSEMGMQEDTEWFQNQTLFHANLPSVAFLRLSKRDSAPSDFSVFISSSAVPDETSLEMLNGWGTGGDLSSTISLESALDTVMTTHSNSNSITYTPSSVNETTNNGTNTNFTNETTPHSITVPASSEVPETVFLPGVFNGTTGPPLRIPAPMTTSIESMTESPSPATSLAGYTYETTLRSESTLPGLTSSSSIHPPAAYYGSTSSVNETTNNGTNSIVNTNFTNEATSNPLSVPSSSEIPETVFLSGVFNGTTGPPLRISASMTTSIESLTESPSPVTSLAGYTYETTLNSAAYNGTPGPPVSPSAPLTTMVNSSTEASGSYAVTSLADDTNLIYGTTLLSYSATLLPTSAPFSLSTYRSAVYNGTSGLSLSGFGNNETRMSRLVQVTSPGTSSTAGTTGSRARSNGLIKVTNTETKLNLAYTNLTVNSSSANADLLPIPRVSSSEASLQPWQIPRLNSTTTLNSMGIVFSNQTFENNSALVLMTSPLVSMLTAPQTNSTESSKSESQMSYLSSNQTWGLFSTNMSELMWGTTATAEDINSNITSMFLPVETYANSDTTPQMAFSPGSKSSSRLNTTQLTFGSGHSPSTFIFLETAASFLQSTGAITYQSTSPSLFANGINSTTPSRGKLSSASLRPTFANCTL